MNSKAKGNSFERQISKDLSLWWSDGEKDDLFWRTQNSGGRFTIRMKDGLQTTGQSSDITSTNSESELFTKKFSIECKNYKNVDLWNLFEENGDLIKWWNDLENICILEKLNPLLIVHANYKPTIILCNHFMKNLLNKCSVEYKFKIILSCNVIYLYNFNDFIHSDAYKFKYELKNMD